MNKYDLSTAGKRLTYARERAGYKSKAAAAKAVKMKEVSYRALENDQHGLSKHAVDLAKVFNVPVEWLLEGGDLVESDHSPAPATAVPPPTLQEIASEHGIAFVEEVDLALGMGASYLDASPPEVIGLVPFRQDWLRDVAEGSVDRLKVVRGRGDSMQPTIMDGDIVLVDTAHRRIDDQDRIWALAYGELGVIRRVRVTPRGSWLLMPDNEVVRPEEVGDGEVHVIGRVIWIGRKI